MFYYTNTGVNLVRAKSSREMCGARSQSCDKRSNKWTCAILWANSDNISAKPSICIVIVMKRYDRIDWQPPSQILPCIYLISVAQSARSLTAAPRNTQNLVFVKREIMRRTKPQRQRTTTTNHLRLENTFIEGNTCSDSPR